LEGVDVLRQRVTEASRHIDRERLGISPQCGFASSIIGNTISAAEQQRKLELVARAAAAIWG
jgi:5-methyltetrahydropteroyltriglutamate--homocysteine methyltransferase